jgi:hypothetical protein
MKTIFFSALVILSAFTILLFSCRKEHVNPDNAILTGSDMRYCVCCGGIMITFSNDPTPYQATFYDIDTIAPNSVISDTITFPKYVKVKWHFESRGCPAFVAIDEIVLR